MQLLMQLEKMKKKKLHVQNHSDSPSTRIISRAEFFHSQCGYLPNELRK